MHRWSTKEVVWVSALVAAVAVLGVTIAWAQSPDPAQCPPGAKSCKVITLTPDEEQSLLGPNMIFEHAEWANRAGLAGIVAAWRGKIANAPAGKVEPEKK